MGILNTLVTISKNMLLDVLVCQDGSLLYIKEIIDAAEEMVYIGTDLQLTHKYVCQKNKAKCAESFTIGITKMIKQMLIISGDTTYLKLSSGMCAANILISFAERLQIADLHGACST
uniref:Uncharacterized protein n=1 Tax=Glossina morsitans morsitans TaxID=37546 RepID=A0A1B0FM69_GLOMM